MEDPGRIQGLVDVSGKALGNLNMCHHCSHGQFLIITGAHAFPLVRACRKKVEKVKLVGRSLKCLKLILALAGRGLYNRYLQITADFMELIDGCTASRQLSHRATRSSKRLSRASLRILTSL